MKEIKDDKNSRNIYHAFGLEESILSKWLHYPRQSTDKSMQSLSKNLKIWQSYSHQDSMFGPGTKTEI